MVQNLWHFWLDKVEPHLRILERSEISIFRLNSEIHKYRTFNLFEAIIKLFDFLEILPTSRNRDIIKKYEVKKSDIPYFRRLLFGFRLAYYFRRVLAVLIR